MKKVALALIVLIVLALIIYLPAGKGPQSATGSSILTKVPANATGVLWVEDFGGLYDETMQSAVMAELKKVDLRAIPDLSENDYNQMMGVITTVSEKAKAFRDLFSGPAVAYITLPDTEQLKQVMAQDDAAIEDSISQLLTVVAELKAQPDVLNQMKTMFNWTPDREQNEAGVNALAWDLEEGFEGVLAVKDNFLYFTFGTDLLQKAVAVEESASIVGKPTFKTAMAELPAASRIKCYVDGGEIRTALNTVTGVLAEEMPPHELVAVTSMTDVYSAFNYLVGGFAGNEGDIFTDYLRMAVDFEKAPQAWSQMVKGQAAYKVGDLAMVPEDSMLYGNGYVSLKDLLNYYVAAGSIPEPSLDMVFEQIQVFTGLTRAELETAIQGEFSLLLHKVEVMIFPMPMLAISLPCKDKAVFDKLYAAAKMLAQGQAVFTDAELGKDVITSITIQGVPVQPALTWVDGQLILATQSSLLKTMIENRGKSTIADHAVFKGTQSLDGNWSQVAYINNQKLTETLRGLANWGKSMMGMSASEAEVAEMEAFDKGILTPILNAWKTMDSFSGFNKWSAEGVNENWYQAKQAKPQTP